MKNSSAQNVRRFLLLTILLVCAGSLRAQNPTPTPYPADQFDKTTTMVTTRDGARLYTEYYVPKNIKGPLPIIFMRTPYGISGWFERGAGGFLKELVDESYIFAFQDIRGRFKSDGKFVMQRPPRETHDDKTIDEGTDTWDTIDWLVKNVPHNNGRVGMFGTSYDGWLVVMALLEPHPALKAACEQATPADMFLGDDFHHNGAFRLSYGFEYAFELESSNENAHFNFDRYDTYEWYLKLGALSNADAKYFHGKLPTWTNFVNHPNYDSFWTSNALGNQLKPLTVPTMHVGGWWDQEDFYGPLKAYEVLEKSDKNHLNYLVVGPWNHGGWERPEGNQLGNIDFGMPASKYFREKLRAPWFAHFLKDKSDWSQAEAITFETGSNQWMSYDSWPPRKAVTERKLYFGRNGQLSFEPPASNGRQAFDSYVSDPEHPVPYRVRPVEPTYNPATSGGSRWYTWLVEDQRFVQNRSDVLTWETEPLKEDLSISGDIVAHLFASTSGSDGDFIVKLIDVYPEQYPTDPKMGGYELMIADEILRGRFRRSFAKPEPIVPLQTNEYVIDLHTNDHRFLKGHRIMVQVQSSWFPLYDRNPQKFVPNIFMAKDADYQAATQRIFRSQRFPSHVTLPVRQTTGG
jgi:hypothetical protein